MLVLKLLILLTLANGTPVIAKKLLGQHLSWPLDGGARLADGNPVFGPSKTVRGVVLAIVATILGAAWLGLGWQTGAIVGSVAMMGDLLSSFVKRRLGLASSSMALGLDQIPESLLPLLAVQPWLPVTLTEIVLLVAIFFFGELALSRILFKLHIRDKPY